MRQAIEEAQKEKLEQKRKRKEAKEASRKAAELKRLREEVNTLYVSRGEFKDSTLSHEISEVNGHHAKTGCVGAIGGFLGQMALVISGAHKKAKQAGLSIVLDPRVVQNFLLLYIDSRMKTEKFTMQVGRAVE